MGTEASATLQGGGIVKSLKIIAYEVRPDEQEEFQVLSAELGVELILCQDVPSRENAGLAADCAGVSILGQGTIDAGLLDLWHQQGVRFLSTRTIGYDHIDLEYAKKRGIRVCNARYAPNGVAEFTIMLMLMSIRYCKQAM